MLASLRLIFKVNVVGTMGAVLRQLAASSLASCKPAEQCTSTPQSPPT